MNSGFVDYSSPSERQLEFVRVLCEQQNIDITTIQDQIKTKNVIVIIVVVVINNLLTVVII
jgi:hypothetical protein